MAESHSEEFLPGGSSLRSGIVRLSDGKRWCFLTPSSLLFSKVSREPDKMYGLSLFPEFKKARLFFTLGRPSQAWSQIAPLILLVPGWASLRSFLVSPRSRSPPKPGCSPNSLWRGTRRGTGGWQTSGRSLRPWVRLLLEVHPRPRRPAVRLCP